MSRWTVVQSLCASLYDCPVPAPRQPTPPYLRVAAELRGQIERGELLPGEQVPSIVVLCAKYSISRGTARRVLTQLDEWGLVDVQQGWGTFVRDRGAS